MKKSLILMAMMLVSVMSFAQNYKTLVLNVAPQMRCANCESKVQAGLKAVSGVKEVETCLTSQTVTVKYDGKQTGDGKIVKALNDMGYQAKKAGKSAKKKGCCKPDCKKKSADCCNNKKAKDCCEKTKTCCMKQSGCDKQMKGCDKAKKGCDKEMKGCDKQKKDCCDKAKKECPQGAKADCCKEKK